MKALRRAWAAISGPSAASSAPRPPLAGVLTVGDTGPSTDGPVLFHPARFAEHLGTAPRMTASDAERRAAERKLSMAMVQRTIAIRRMISMQN